MCVNKYGFTVVTKDMKGAFKYDVTQKGWEGGRVFDFCDKLR